MPSTQFNNVDNETTVTRFSNRIAFGNAGMLCESEEGQCADDFTYGATLKSIVTASGRVVYERTKAPLTKTSAEMARLRADREVSRAEEYKAIATK